MNKRQKKKLMKKYVIKGRIISAIAKSLKNMAGYSFPETQLIDITREVLLTRLHFEYQNEIYNKVIHRNLFALFNQTNTLADIHRMHWKYDYHMDLNYKQKDMRRMIRLFHRELSATCVMYDNSVPIRIKRSESDPECPKIISFKRSEPFDIHKIPEEDLGKFKQNIHALNTFIQEVQDE